jgi:hypothetical protein
MQDFDRTAARTSDSSSDTLTHKEESLFQGYTPTRDIDQRTTVPLPAIDIFEKTSTSSPVPSTIDNSHMGPGKSLDRSSVVPSDREQHPLPRFEDSQKVAQRDLNSSQLNQFGELTKSIKDAYDLTYKPDVDGKPNNVAAKVAEDIAKTGDIKLLSKLVSMAGSAELVNEVNEHLKAQGSKLSVQASEGSTIVEGADAGRYKIISLELTNASGKVIGSSTPVDEWNNRKNSIRKSGQN